MKFFIIASLVIATATAAPHWYNLHHGGYAEIGKDGKVKETPEVAHAKAEHFAAIAKAGGYAQGHDLSGGYHQEEPHHDYHHHEEHHDQKYDGKYGYHYPVIKHGVPVEPIEVQHARAEHFAAVAKAPKDPHYHEPEQHHHYKRSADYYHVPVIHNGVPVDTPAVQHAKAAHAAAHAKAAGHGHYVAEPHYEEPKHYEEAHHSNHHADHDLRYDGKLGYHYPTIHKGVPVDTAEVQHAREHHYALYHEAAAHAGNDHDDGQYDEKKYGHSDDGHHYH